MFWRSTYLSALVFEAFKVTRRPSPFSQVWYPKKRRLERQEGENSASHCPRAATKSKIQPVQGKKWTPWQKLVLTSSSIVIVVAQSLIHNHWELPPPHLLVCCHRQQEQATAHKRILCKLWKSETHFRFGQLFKQCSFHCFHKIIQQLTPQSLCEGSPQVCSDICIKHQNSQVKSCFVSFPYPVLTSWRRRKAVCWETFERGD